jgi:hypothetical protein
LDGDGNPEFVYHSGSNETRIIQLFGPGRDLLEVDHQPVNGSSDFHNLSGYMDEPGMGVVLAGTMTVFAGNAGTDFRIPVVVRLNAGKPVLVPELTRTAQIDEAWVSEIVARCHKPEFVASSGREQALNLIDDTALNLIFHGHRERAYRFIDEAWTGSAGDKQAFVAELQDCVKNCPVSPPD